MVKPWKIEARGVYYIFFFSSFPFAYIVQDDMIRCFKYRIFFFFLPCGPVVVAVFFHSCAFCFSFNSLRAIVGILKDSFNYKGRYKYILWISAR